MVHWTPPPRGPSPGPVPPNMGPEDLPTQTQSQDPQPTSLLVTSGGHHWKSVQTCSLQNPLPSRRYASCWNASLLLQANLLTLMSMI